MIKQINFLKADLDTVSTAALLTASLDNIKIVHLENTASNKDLNDSSILCIECGGDGLCALDNYDHHSNENLPCATVQAYEKIGSPKDLLEFVDHVSYIDAGKRLCNTPLPTNQTNHSLSSIFSGMLYLYQDETERFIKGYELIKEIMSSENCLNNVWDIPLVSDNLRTYAQAKSKLRKSLECKLCDVHTVIIDDYKIMILHSELAGVHGLLKKNGADISIAINDNFHKISISFTPKTLPFAKITCEKLNNIELGWGGHIDTGIIASPYQGTTISEDALTMLLTHVIREQSNH